VDEHCRVDAQLAPEGRTGSSAIPDTLFRGTMGELCMKDVYEIVLVGCAPVGVGVVVGLLYILPHVFLSNMAVISVWWAVLSIALLVTALWVMFGDRI